jgi:hypothetical protein
MDIERAVEFIARPKVDGLDPSYGSGYCLGGGLILTCAHIVPADATAYKLTVRSIAHRGIADPMDLESPVSVAWCNRQQDIALLHLTETKLLDFAPISLYDLSFVSKSGSVPFEMYGWPRSGDSPDGPGRIVRDPVHIDGEIKIAEFHGSLSRKLRLRPRENYPARETGSFWAGMSGAAVFVKGALVAVQNVQPDRQLPSYLDAGLVNPDALSIQDEHCVSGVDVLAAAGIRSGERLAVGSESDWPVLVGDLPRGADCFQERPEQEKLMWTLRRTNTVVITQVLTGMGGVGKTQLAAEYATTEWRSRNVDLLLWVNASSRLSIISAYANAAERTGIVSPEQVPHLNKTAKRFQSWLAETTDRKWLIVLDDVADPDDLAQLKPPLSALGRCIVTTRKRDPSHYARGWQSLEIGLFTVEQARDYLHDRLRGYPSDTLIGADALAEELGLLPLALAHASAYIRYIADSRGKVTGPATCRDYRDLLADRMRTTLVDIMPATQIDDYERTLAATWSISIERADQQTPVGGTRRVMELLSLLDPNGIPSTLFDSLSIQTYLGLSSSDEIMDALRNLRTFSLIDFGDTDDDPIRVHMLVQRAVRETTRTALDNATRILADSFSAQWPTHQHNTRLAQLQRSNALALATGDPRWLQTPQPHPLLFQLGDSYGQAGLVIQAAEYFTTLREQSVEILGADNRGTLKIRERSAYWLGFTGNVTGALQEFEALAADQTRVLGPDDLDTLIARHNVARFRGRSGDPAGAVADLERLVDDETRVLGPYDLETLKSRNILGYWRSKSGDNHGAVADLEELLTILIEMKSADDPETLTTRNDLAIARAEAGDLTTAIAEAEPLVADRARVLGDEHPSTLSSKVYLALWKAIAGDHESDAIEFDTIVADHIRVLGDRHPNTLRALAYRIQASAVAGNIEAAITKMSELLEVVEDILGSTHILTTHCRQNIAIWRDGGTRHDGQ